MGPRGMRVLVLVLVLLVGAQYCTAYVAGLQSYLMKVLASSSRVPTVIKKSEVSPLRT